MSLFFPLSLVKELLLFRLSFLIVEINCVVYSINWNIEWTYDHCGRDIRRLSKAVLILSISLHIPCLHFCTSSSLVKSFIGHFNSDWKINARAIYTSTDTLSPLLIPQSLNVHPIHTICRLGINTFDCKFKSIIIPLLVVVSDDSIWIVCDGIACDKLIYNDKSSVGCRVVFCLQTKDLLSSRKGW